MAAIWIAACLRRALPVSCFGCAGRVSAPRCAATQAILGTRCPRFPSSRSLPGPARADSSIISSALSDGQRRDSSCAGVLPGSGRLHHRLLLLQATMAPWICRESFSKRSDVGRLFRRLATVRQREVLSPIFVSLESRMHQDRPLVPVSPRGPGCDLLAVRPTTSVSAKAVVLLERTWSALRLNGCSHG